MSKYVHLHAHTDASLQDGLFGIKKWVKAIKERGLPGHAITDHGSMANALPFYHAMRKEKLTPIIGCEFYYCDNPTDKSPANRKSTHLILLAKNYDGYQNMLKLMRLSFTEGYYFKNRIGFDWLAKHSEGLVCLTACMGGVLSREVWKEFNGETITVGLENQFKKFSALFGEDFYVEFQGHNIHARMPDGTEYNSQAMINEEFYARLRKLKGFQQVVTNDCHYITQEHAKIQRMIKNISWKQKKDESAESGTMSEEHHCDSLWLKNGREVLQSFEEHHEYLPKTFVIDGMRNSAAIYEKCKDFVLPTGIKYLPQFREKINSKSFFKGFTIKLLKEFLASDRLIADKDEYVARFKKEYKVISTYALEDYFLIVWDIVRFARSRNIAVGIGRGSSAGALISFLMGIVRVDPLEFDLLFERFLNEHRCVGGELPDIDLDFESNRRHEIKKYIYDTYGVDNVCEIGTYGRMKLKTALLDFGKILAVAEYKDLVKLTKNIDNEKESLDDLDEAMRNDSKLDALIQANPDYGYAVREIIGQMKSQSIHPAGVLIANTKISDVIPVKTQKRTLKPEEQVEGEDKDVRVLTSQPEDKHVIAEGLLKMDILGLKEYDIMKFILENDPQFVAMGMNLDNYVEMIMAMNRRGELTHVWKMFSKGLTEAVFQFSSDGMKGLLQMMQPRYMNDLIAANALYRPGCLNNGWHILYCKRKNGEEETVYDHELIEECTKDTFGVLVYQEQVMRILNTLGGINLVEADTIRSALGKKDVEKLDKYGPMFIEGASKHISKEKAEALWLQIRHASEYSFNKSHSAVYSVLAFVSQYFKATSPNYFFAAHFYWNVKKKETEDLLQNKKVASAMGIEFILPEINKSGVDMVVDGDNIISSLTLVKSVGRASVNEIVKHQPFKNFFDFHKRVNKAKVKYNVIQNLIYAGCFDEFGDRRELLKWLAENTKKKEYEKLSDEQMMLKFHECVGFYEQKIKNVIPGFSPLLSTQQDLPDFSEGDDVRVGGIITSVRSIKTKNGDNMGFCTIEDLDELIDVTIFPREWAKQRKSIQEGLVVELCGRKSEFNGKQNLLEAVEFIVISDRVVK